MKRFHKKPFIKKDGADTSWEKSSNWYGKIVKDEGHYYHEHVILPRLKEILKITQGSKVIDIGCGEGVFARTIPAGVHYTGIDLSPSLIALARKKSSSNSREFMVGDATQPMHSAAGSYTHAVAILSLQNMESARNAIANVGKMLGKGGAFAFVLNHPAFRIPRQSGWELDPGSSEQKRWVKRYMSDLKIPIEMRPGLRRNLPAGGKGGPVTWSFHRPIEAWVKDVADAGMAVVAMEEWVSDKKSTSKFKGREDQARAEIPLFMCVVAKKI